MNTNRLITIESKLKEAFNINTIEVIDESDAHKGHIGWREHEVTHVFIKIISDDFIALSRVERHKLLYQVLKKELESHIHALRIKALTSQEEKNISLGKNNG